MEHLSPWKLNADIISCRTTNDVLEASRHKKFFIGKFNKGD
jgi:hypothetical protein